MCVLTSYFLNVIWIGLSISERNGSIWNPLQLAVHNIMWQNESLVWLWTWYWFSHVGISSVSLSRNAWMFNLSAFFFLRPCIRKICPAVVYSRIMQSVKQHFFCSKSFFDICSTDFAQIQILIFAFQWLDNNLRLFLRSPSAFCIFTEVSQVEIVNKITNPSVKVG